MTNKLRDFLDDTNRRNIATAYGTDFHNRLQNIRLDDIGDELVQRILATPDLVRLFDALSKAEVPVAGNINGKFVSRRIDRLRIDAANKTIEILDYKTDINHDARRMHYIAQLDEYKNLMLQIYPDFKITCFILWVHDWMLEQV